MEFTGERMMPEININEGIYLEHLVRYKFASQFVKGKVVLDIASGSGYGSNLLSMYGAKKIIGVDVSKEAVDYCKNKYPNVDFLEGNVSRIPLEDASVDVVVSFETIEHVSEKDQILFMLEVKRVLKSDGKLIISTPNVKVSTNNNEFHLKELALNEFEEILKNSFDNVDILYQDVLEASMIASKKELKDEIANINEKFLASKINSLEIESCLFFIAICSNEFSNDVLYKNEIILSNVQPWKLYKKFADDYKSKQLELDAMIEHANKQAEIIHDLSKQLRWQKKILKFLRIK